VRLATLLQRGYFWAGLTAESFVFVDSNGDERFVKNNRTLMSWETPRVMVTTRSWVPIIESA